MYRRQGRPVVNKVINKVRSSAMKYVRINSHTQIEVSVDIPDDIAIARWMEKTRRPEKPPLIKKKEEEEEENDQDLDEIIVPDPDDLPSADPDTTENL